MRSVHLVSPRFRQPRQNKRQDMADIAKKKATKLREGFMTIQFSEIHSPGVYVTQRGEMFRVPGEALAEGHSPFLVWESLEGNLVCRITEDPYCPISKCRQLTADADLPVNF